jgi:hypothetical protein
MCGSRCDLCKAFSQNIEKKDEREQLSALWKKYYELDIPANSIYCVGCRCSKTDAKRLDPECPVRNCVIKKGVLHCGQCDEYPCETFSKREGYNLDDLKKIGEEKFDPREYNDFLVAYDNSSNISQYKNKLLK